MSGSIKDVQICIENYENSHGFTPRNVTISWFMFQELMRHKFVKEWEDTMRHNDLAIITDIGLTNIWVDKNQKESVIVG